ncbi:MAG: TonB-dependent receptor [Alphaproteobacteria bacterium HGW-Alphaproteobacteria-16]|nr:MAG: TonB-dependent receptor [Alphaproteobacteria bacterium HGW-Alphaproteobacteria-16]
MVTQSLGPFEAERSPRATAALPWIVGAALLAALIWFIYTQLTASGIGVAVPAPSQQEVNLLPPPPPPPPPPPEPQEKPPEPTEQPQPSPMDAPKAAQQQAAPVSIAAPAQAGSDAYGLQSGSGQGSGAPSSKGTCIGPNCGSAPAGGGMSVGMYTSYLKSALQERVQDDPRLGRLVFSADYVLTVTQDGRITGVRFRSAKGGSDSDMQKLTGLLQQVRGLDPPPAAMAFPQLVTVRGRRSSF